jgi:ERCC4-type nuclease
MIQIDYRETQLLKQFEKLEKKVESSNLDTGDIILYGLDTVLVIERKTAADLESSIKSGRLNDQRNRLKAFRSTDPRVKLCLILEHPFIKANKMMSGCIENMVLLHDIYVIRTKDIADTAETILSMYTKINNEKSQQKTIVQNFKRKTSLMDNMLLHQLVLVTGVSEHMASCIVKEYKDIFTLVKDLTESYSETVKKLQEIDLGKRKIGPVVVKRICESFGIPK